MFSISVAAQGDYVRVLAEQQDVWDRAGFASFNEFLLERARGGVGQEACAYLPADFFWVVHEPLKTHRWLPDITWRIEVRRYECHVNCKPKSTAARFQKTGPAATMSKAKSTEPAGRRRY